MVQATYDTTVDERNEAEVAWRYKVESDDERDGVKVTSTSSARRSINICFLERQRYQKCISCHIEPIDSSSSEEDTMNL